MRLPLVLKFDPQTVDHLGARMYSHLPNAVAELVANAYDADATLVDVVIGPGSNEIEVRDDGHGMSREEVSEKYLRIGRNRRQSESGDRTESGRRRVSGKKGLGKLALFGIGTRVRLETKREGMQSRTCVDLDYQEMMEAEGEYRPREESESDSRERHGTSVKVTGLKRKSPIVAEDLAKSLSRLFDYADSDFELRVVPPKGKGEPIGVRSDMRYERIDAEFEWNFPEDFSEKDSLLRSNAVRGRIVASAKPQSPGMRGVTLYASGRMVNEPEFFGASESSFAFSYLAGSLTIDFIDRGEVDFVATDRRSLDWGHEETAELKKALASLLRRIGREWRTRRDEKNKEAAKNRFTDQEGVSLDEWISSLEPGPRKDALSLLIERVLGDPGIPSESKARTIGFVKDSITHRPEYDLQGLDAEILKATATSYIDGKYAQAVVEAVKKFIALLREKHRIEDNDHNLIQSAFGKDGAVRTTAAFPDGTFSNRRSRDNIEDGQQLLAMGIIKGFRNPLAHETFESMLESKVFTPQDCLGAIILVSHLTRRLKEAELREG